ncbi:MAG: RsmD family RNA methyltransferase [Pirellulales bacterium]
MPKPYRDRRRRDEDEPADDSPVAKSPQSEAPDVAGIRIIGGDARGRKLKYSGDARTRPMKDRVREAVFNLLGRGIKGTLVVDLFAGTGALGIEALSRGAKWGVFLEKHFPTAELIEANLREVGLGDKAQVIGGDTFLQLRLMRRDGRTFSIPPNAASQGEAAAEPAPWLVFCSPPYEFYAVREAEMQRLLDDVIALAPPQSTLVVEADERFDPQKLPQPEQWTERRYPPAVVLWRQL